MRSICARVKRVKKGLDLKAVFAAWKNEFGIVKRFCCRVDQAANSLANLSKHISFDLIRRYAISKHEKIVARKTQSRKRLEMIFGHYYRT